MDKRDKLREFYDEYIANFKDKIVVTGIGNIDAKLLLIGEAPGKDEIKENEPFVGAAGKNLNIFLNSIGVKREDIFITNSIKYRLSKPSSLTGRLVNTPAKRIDIEMNREYLIREIGIISPEIIVTLGNVPLKSVTGDFKLNIGDVHGMVLNIKMVMFGGDEQLSLIHISEPTRRTPISYAVFC